MKHVGILGKTLLSGLNRLCFRVLIPILLFRSVYLSKRITYNDIKAVVFSVIMILISFVIAILIADNTLEQRNQRGVLIQASIRSNFSVIGIPLVATLFGEESVVTVALLSMATIPLFNVLSVCALTFYSDNAGRKVDVKKLFEELLNNPLLKGIAVGIGMLLIRKVLIWQDCSFRLTSIPGLYNAIDMLANASTPLALIVLGGEFSVVAAKCYARPVLIGTFMRIVFVPLLCVGAGIILFPEFNGSIFATLVALFGTPVSVSSAIMAAEMGGDGELARQLVVWSTLFSPLTLFIFIVALRMIGVV